MGLTTYAELKTSLASWFHDRTDVANIADDLIDLAEARFNREIVSRRMDTSTTLTITSGAATIPTGLLKVRSIVLTAYPYTTLEYTPIDMLERLDPTITTPPERFCEVGSSFVMWPPTSAASRIRYRGKITPLDGTNTSNWILADHPDLYLKASLLGASEYFVDDDRIPLWERQVTAMIKAVNELDRDQNQMGLRPILTSTVT